MLSPFLFPNEYEKMDSYNITVHTTVVRGPRCVDADRWRGAEVARHDVVLRSQHDNAKCYNELRGTQSSD